MKIEKIIEIVESVQNDVKTFSNTAYMSDLIIKRLKQEYEEEEKRKYFEYFYNIAGKNVDETEFKHFLNLTEEFLKFENNVSKQKAFELMIEWYKQSEDGVRLSKFVKPSCPAYIWCRLLRRERNDEY